MLSAKQRDDIAADVYSVFFTNEIPIDSIEIAAICLSNIIHIEHYVAIPNWTHRRPEYRDMTTIALAIAIRTIYFHSIEIVDFHIRTIDSYSSRQDE